MFRQLQFHTYGYDLVFQTRQKTHNYIAEKEYEQLDLAQRIQLPSLIIVINFQRPVPQQTCSQDALIYKITWITQGNSQQK